MFSGINNIIKIFKQIIPLIKYMENQLCLCNGKQISSINYVIYMASILPFIVVMGLFSIQYIVAKTIKTGVCFL